MSGRTRRLASIGVAAICWAGCDRDPDERPPAPAAPSTSVPAVASLGPPLGPPKARTPPALSPEETTALYEGIGKIFADHAKDACPQLVEALGAFVHTHEERLRRVRAQVIAHLENDARLARRFRTAMDPVMTGSMRCKDSPALRAVVDRLERARDEPPPPAQHRAERTPTAPSR